MFSQHLNQIRIDLSITPRGPMLIRTGRTGADPTRPNLEWVRTTVDGRPSVYVPGSSLKGVLRAYCERLLTSEGVKITNTFSKEGQKVFQQHHSGPEVYAGTCPLGRTFGNLHLQGHTSVSDHIPGGHEPPGSTARQRELDAANAVETRNGVGIDRLLGSSSTGALFDREVVVAGRFDGQILLRNVQLYQLALLLVALRDLDQGFLQLGSGTTRGQGWVRAEIRQLVIESRRGRAPEGELLGAGRLLRATDNTANKTTKDTKAYRLFEGDSMPLPTGWRAEPKFLWERLQCTEPAAIETFAEGLLAGPWSRFLDSAQKREGWAA
jgi:CRISPR/Cas system CSM-associated protein Csm3 (group 7 of RAMP superfamily)